MSGGTGDGVGEAASSGREGEDREVSEDGDMVGVVGSVDSGEGREIGGAGGVESL